MSICLLCFHVPYTSLFVSTLFMQRIEQLAPAYQCATSTRRTTKAKHTRGPALFLRQISFYCAIRIETLLNPALEVAPYGGEEQIIEGRHNQQFKNSKGG